MTSLSLAALFWLVLHLIVAGPLRSPLVAILGERFFFVLFSLLSVAGLGWFYYAYPLAPFYPLWPMIPALGWVVYVLVFLGILLNVVGSAPTNATSTKPVQMIDNKLPVYGITRVTRHPRLVGVTIWAIAHLMVNGQIASVIMFGSVLITTVNGMVSIDRKRRRKLGPIWDEFEAQTSRVPFAAILADRIHFEPGEFHVWQVAVAAALFAGVFWLHGVIGLSPLYILQQ